MLRFFLPVLLLGVCLPIGTMTLVQPIFGDLARIGFLPERAFGWNAPQPAVATATSNVTPGNAEILVVGDSFTWTGRWQAAAFGEGQRYVSYGFGAVCADIGDYMHHEGLAPKVVVVETVERTFVSRLFSTCAKSELKAGDPNAGPKARQRDTSLLYGSFGAKYAIGSLFYLASPGPRHRSGNSGGVDVRPVADGCKRFSHRDCAYGLFLGDDTLQPTFPLDEFQSPLINYLKAAGIKTIIVVSVPNKTSAYMQSEEEARASDKYLGEFARRNGVHALALHERFTAYARQYRDFYFPDDTHLSDQGMTILGGEIGRIVREQVEVSQSGLQPDIIN